MDDVQLHACACAPFVHMHACSCWLLLPLTCLFLFSKKQTKLSHNVNNYQYPYMDESANQNSYIV